MVIAALVMVLILATRLSADRYAADHPPRGKVLEVGGVRTHVLRGGQGPPVVLLHGLNGVLEDFTGALIDRLAENHEIVAFDRPGYGHSEPAPDLADPRRQADWIVELFDELGLEKPLVVGHSLGGGLATMLAVHHPDRVRGLVLLAPYVYPYSEPDGWIHNLPDLPLLRSTIGHLFLLPVGRLIGPSIVRASFHPEEIPEGYQARWSSRTLRPNHFDTIIGEVRAIDPALMQVVDRYHDIEVPVTILAGEEDQSVDSVANAQRLIEVLPEAELVWLEDAGHMIPWTRPELVADAVDGVEKRAGALSER